MGIYEKTSRLNDKDFQQIIGVQINIYTFLSTMILWTTKHIAGLNMTEQDLKNKTPPLNGTTDKGRRLWKKEQ